MLQGQPYKIAKGKNSPFEVAIEGDHVVPLEEYLADRLDSSDLYYFVSHRQADS